MKLLCVDPGPSTSGVVIYDDMRQEIDGVWSEYVNQELIDTMPALRSSTDYMVVEWVKNYGMSVGESVFLTVEYIGRLRQVYGWNRSVKLPRLEVKELLCHTHHAKDSNIRQALIDRFPATGHGSVPQIGTKKHPGPLYGVKSHAWAALALGVAYAEKGRVTAL